jgi:hypothetical protein
LLAIDRSLTGWLIAELGDCDYFYSFTYVCEAPSAFSSYFTAIATSSVVIVIVVLVTRY